jgi:beta-lactam-binding protein with PASTA domain
MRTCQSCGRENPADQDFCQCGEYLRWEPTGLVQAITPEMADAAAAAAPPAEPAAPAPPPPGQPAPAAPPPAQVTQAPPPPARPGNGHSDPLPASPPSPTGTAVQGAAAGVPMAPQPPAEPPESQPATITLRLPDEDASPGETLAVGVHPGDRVRVRALVRNQSGIVDNYQLRVDGLPADWYSVLPDTVYLVPYGSGGTYEQDVEIHFHPPRAADAEARIWELTVVAHSKAHEVTAATAPLLLGIQPFEDHKTKVKPERASGRRKADFKVAVENKANAPVYVAFDATEPDNECGFRFEPAGAEIAPGETATSTMRVRPPKQMWIGRPHERRIEVAVKSGEEAHAFEAAQAEQEGESGSGGTGLRGKLGGMAPRVYKPQVYKGNLHIGPGGIQMSKPMVRGPQVAGGRGMHGMNVNLDKLKMPGSGAPAVTGPLLPSQAVFRQKPWLPWWVAIVVPLLALLALLLFLFLPKNVTVPEVVGKASAFDAEQAITEAKLRMAPQIKEKVDPKATPGSVVDQTPDPGETVEEGSEVAILVAVGTGKITVPSVVGKTPGEAEKILREAGLTLGAASPAPADPEGKIASQIPAEKEVVKEGAPVDIFMAKPKEGGEGAGGAAAGAGNGEGGEEGEGGAGGGGPIKVPEIAGATDEVYAQKVGDGGLTPVVKRAFDSSEKGTIFRVVPKPGEEVEPGTEVQVFVSLGFPQLAFDDDEDVLLVTGDQGEKLEKLAKGSQDEGDPAWSFDTTRVAFTSDGQVFVRNLTKKDASPIAVTAEDQTFTDLAWAPTAETDTIAMLKRGGGGTLADEETSLCFGRLAGGQLNPRCKPVSDNVLGRKLNWSPNGKRLLAFAATRDGSEIGMLGYRSEKPYSANPDDWEPEGFVTDTSKPGQGVLDAAFSPDGKTVAAAVLGKDGRSQLVFGDPKNLLLPDGEPQEVSACKVIWRPDGLQLVVVQADDCLNSETGELVLIDAANPQQDQQSLELEGDNPVFQPLSLE